MALLHLLDESCLGYDASLLSVNRVKYPLQQMKRLLLSWQ